MENLKKCPICNCTPISFVAEPNNHIVLRCPDIDCDFPYAVGGINKESAIRKWNRCCEQWDKENKTNGGKLI